MRVTEQIADTLLRLLEEQGGAVRIQRNDLASRLGCVPSQINYVISSRFTREQGYIVESRRGGGGFIQIARIECTEPSLIMHVVNSIGQNLDEGGARGLIQGLYEAGQLNEGQVRLLLAASADRSLSDIAEPARQRLRANLMKSMLLQVV